jgi:hypothetical protein
MASLGEVSSALHGAWRLAFLDRAGMAYFDRSQRGFWRSFNAGVLVYPAFLILLDLRVEDAQWESAGWFRIVLVETLGYVITWVGFPLLMLEVARFLGRTARWHDFVIAYNWSQVLQYAFFLVATLLVGWAALAPGLSEALAVMAVLVPSAYEWLVVRVALEVGGLPALMVVLLDIVFSLLIDRVVGALY